MIPMTAFIIIVALVIAAAVLVIVRHVVAATSALTVAVDGLQAAARSLADAATSAGDAGASLRRAADRLCLAADTIESAQSLPCFAVMPRVFDIQSAAVYLGTTPVDVHALVRDGKLRRIAGEPARFSRAALDEALDLGLGPRASTRGAA